jgi:hypothetical protein
MLESILDIDRALPAPGHTHLVVVENHNARVNLPRYSEDRSERHLWRQGSCNGTSQTTPTASGDVNVKPGRNRLSLTHPLQAFELAQGSIEFAAQVGLDAQEAIGNLWGQDSPRCNLVLVH